MTEQDFNQIRQIVSEIVIESEARTKANLDGAVAELIARQDRTDQTVAGLSAKLDRTDQTVAGLSAKLDRTDQAVAGLSAKLDRAVADLTAKQDRAVESIAVEISGLRAEMNRRFEEVDQRFGIMDRRLERMGESLHGIDVRMIAMNQWAERLDRDNTALHSTQVSQQRAIDQLFGEVDAIKRRLDQPNKN